MEGRQHAHDWTFLTEEEHERFYKYVKRDVKYIRLGPKGFVLPHNFLRHAEEVWKMPVRKDDVFVVTFPRSGTTWTQEMAWLLCNNFNYEEARAKPLPFRFPYLEKYMFVPGCVKKTVKLSPNDKDMENLVKKMKTPATQILAEIPEGQQRFIKTHVPMSLIPERALEAKVIYIARDARDIAVSSYHYLKSFDIISDQCDFKTFFKELFTSNIIGLYTPYFEHIKEGWALRDNPNFLFIFYEELSKDLQGTVARVAKFLGKECSQEQMDQLCEHLRFDNFQKNTSLNRTTLDSSDSGLFRTDNWFIRKGKVGGWREYFDEELAEVARRWIDDNLRDPHLRMRYTSDDTSSDAQFG